ncbi:MAG TPA: hypothetical protein VI911_09080 [Patescibacteria group bacterium]|nr:MAG: hypothetical protein UR43_C0005G0016 [candidate division TM6 bacterium GW2011_GWF2_33_332]OGI30974.1 MAG: hypothetical protein A2343_03700 [Candidatus Moranbacteria bacterium RIFOXYB12_FULL_35_8]HLD91151.1 hypothetical protein [Patescibacteria group bacterium]
MTLTQFEEFMDYLDKNDEAMPTSMLLKEQEIISLKIDMLTQNYNSWAGLVNITNSEILFVNTTIYNNEIHNTYDQGNNMMFTPHKQIPDRFLEYPNQQRPTEYKHKCSCNSLDLFRFGCRCGGK